MGKACNFKRIVPLFLVSAFIFGFLLSLFSLLAPYMGFGEKEEFILYRIIDIRRRDTLQVTLITSILKIKSAFGGIPIEETPCLPYASLAGTMI